MAQPQILIKKLSYPPTVKVIYRAAATHIARRLMVKTCRWYIGIKYIGIKYIGIKYTGFNMSHTCYDLPLLHHGIDWHRTTT